MSLPPLITAMLRPEFFPNRPAEVTLVQTHISYVLLAGDEVYKLKKPVRFAFLDFSTLERRRYFCHEEVRLNRRLAPDVYRGVVAICRDGDTYRLGREDDARAAEYAVHMRRLPADRILARLLDRNQVTPAMIDAIAAKLAAFHRVADAGPEITANGDPAALRAVIEEDLAEMQAFRDQTVPAGDDDAIRSFSLGVLTRDEPLLRRRQAQQRIRDGHGDLHAEHICCSDGLIIFDCIEFNPTFRYRDVAADVAFLAMDLDYHGHAELAVHLVARYAAYAEDPELPRLVPFYQCYRAYVRGKVDTLKSVEEEVAPADREAARASACRHFALAYRYTWSYSPCLVVMAGLSGTGKSAIAAGLHARTGFVHINSDRVRKRLAGVPEDTRATAAAYEGGLYAPEFSERTYRTMFAEAGEHLAAGRGVILDATFQRRDGRDTARALAAQQGVPILLVECRCSDDEVHRRLSHRVQTGAGPSDADWNVYLEQRRRYEACAADEQPALLTLDTTAPVGDLTVIVERELRRRVAREA